MKLTKVTHAGVRLENDGAALVTGAALDGGEERHRVRLAGPRGPGLPLGW